MNLRHRLFRATLALSLLLPLPSMAFDAGDTTSGAGGAAIMCNNGAGVFEVCRSPGGTSSAARNFPGCTVGASSGQCLAASTAVSFLQIQNTSTGTNVACRFGAAAALNTSTSVQLIPGQAASWGPGTNGVPSGALNCIAASGGTPLYVEWN